MSSHHSQNYLALVIKCRRNREQDLLVTLLTQEQGKILTVAKGVRKITSSKRAALETGNLIRVHLVDTKGLPILTQAQLVAGVSPIRQSLAQLRKFVLFIEILDRLFVNEELSPFLFQKILYLRELFLQQLPNSLIKPHFREILAQLGYTDQNYADLSIVNQVNQIADCQLCSFDYLTIRD